MVYAKLMSYVIRDCDTEYWCVHKSPSGRPGRSDHVLITLKFSYILFLEQYFSKMSKAWVMDRPVGASFTNPKDSKDPYERMEFWRKFLSLWSSFWTSLCAATHLLLSSLNFSGLFSFCAALDLLLFSLFFSGSLWFRALQPRKKNTI